jgi:hypothetical protein
MLGLMTWPPPTDRTLLALHLGAGLPLIVLGLWFSLLDRLPFGEGRCSSCGVEGYVIAAHVVAAAWLSGIVACAAAARRHVLEGISAPGPRTTGALMAVALFVVGSLIWHPLSSVPALAAMLASVVMFPIAGIWWMIGLITWRHRPPRTDFELRRGLTGALAAAWVSLTVLLPAVFGWVWADRVDWLVF